MNNEIISLANDIYSAELLMLSLFFPPVRPFASEEEFKATEVIVKNFQQGVGKELHQRLLQRAETRRNWVCVSSLNLLFSISQTSSLLTDVVFVSPPSPPQLEQWWLDTAYLESRSPSQLTVNFAGPAPYLEHSWPPADGTDLERASICSWHILQYWDLIRT